MSLFPRKPRKVRFHFKPDERGESHTVEGVLVAKTRSEYIVLTPKLVQEEDKTISLSGSVEIPRENVLFLQVLS